MKTKKNLVLVHSVLLILVSILAFTTCKVGLGESVDVNKPIISIDYPPHNSDVRDWFIMSGVADDDTYVREVKVVFKKTDLEPMYGTIDKDNKRWSLEVNKPVNGKYPLSDGKYDVTITAKDSMGRTSDTNATYYIDNTPPVLVLQRPATKGNDDINLLDPFGQEIRFNGNWWDERSDNGTKLSVWFYDENGTEIDSIKNHELKVSDWNLIFAEDKSGTVSDIGKLWSKLKSQTQTNTATPFGYTLHLSDYAQEWQKPETGEPSSTQGNTTDHYYIYTEIVNKMEVGEKYPSLMDLSYVENGRSVATNKMPSKVSSELESLKIPAAPNPWDATMGMFSFDPYDSKPSFEIDNLTIPSINGNVNPKNNEVTKFPVFNIRINQNKDGDAIQQDSIKITYIPILSDNVLDEANIDVTQGAALKKGTIGNVISVNYELNLEQGAFRLIIYAQDLAGNKKEEKYDVYINAGAPRLDRISPDKSPFETKVNSNDGKITIIVKGIDGDETVELILTDENDNKLTGIVGASTPAKQKADNGIDNEFTWTLVFDSPGDGNTKTLRFQLDDGQYKSNIEKITFLVDDTLPTLKTLKKPAERSSFPSDDDPANKTLLSEQIVTVQGFADADLEKALLMFIKDGATPPTKQTALGEWTEAPVDNVTNSETGHKGFTGQVSLVKGEEADEGKYTLYARFADDTFDEVLENYGEVIKVLTVLYDKAVPVFNETKNPSMTTALEYKNKAITFGGKVSDTNALATVTVKLNDEEPIDIMPTTGDNWTYTLKADTTEHSKDGVYELIFTATDIAGKKTSFTRNIMIDTKAPILEITFPKTGEFVSGSTPTILGTVDDGSGKGVSSIEYSLDSTDGTDGTWKPITRAASWNAGITLTDPEGSRTLYVRASDGLNTATVKSVTFQYDKNLPTLTEDDSGLSESLVNRNTAVSFGGTASDTNALKSFVVKLNGNEVSSGLSITKTNTKEWSWSYTLSAPSGNSNDGTYKIEFIATDVANRTTIVTRNVTIDTTKPTIEITSNPGAYITNSLSILGTASDTGSGVASTHYRIEDSSSDTVISGNLTGTDNWFSTINTSNTTTYPEGSYTLYVWSVDRAGNKSAEVSQNFTIDRADPVLEEKEVNTPDTQYRRTNITFGGSLTDSYQLAASPLSVRVNNGASNTVSVNSGNWSYEFNVGSLSDGTYTLVFTGRDLVGKEASLTRTVVVDKTGPTITITKPTITDLVRSSYNFSGTTSDGGSGIDTIEYSLNSTNGSDGTWVSAYGTTSWSFTADPAGTGNEGNRVLYIRAIDKAGNISTSTRNFTYDIANPELSITGNANRYANDNFSISGTANDSYGIASITITQQKDSGAIVEIPGASLGLNTEETESNWTLGDLPRNPLNPDNYSLVDGKYTYTITASDKAGQHSIAKTVSVTIDQTPPTVAITAPLEGQTGENALSGSSYSFRGNASDAGVGVSKIWYAITQSTTSPVVISDYTELSTTGSWNFSKQLASELAEGIGYYLHVLAEDLSGNRTPFASAKKVFFDVDLANPTFTEGTSGITNATLVHKNTNVSFGGDCTDGNGIASVVVTYKKDGGSSVELLNQTDGLGTWSTLLETSLGDGSYELTFTATDKAGKSTSFTRNVMIDTHAPILDITSPSASDGVSSESCTISGTVDDGSGKGVQKIEYSFDETNWIEITKAASWNADITITGGEGEKTLYVRASDGLNDPVVETVNFQYDIAPPILAETKINTIDTQYRKENITLTGELRDTNGLPESNALTVSINNEAAISIIVNDKNHENPGSWSYPFDVSSLSDGTYTLVFTGTDIAGKTASLTRTVMVDKTAPSAPVIEPIETYVENSLSISGTASDTGSGVAATYYRIDGSKDDPHNGTLTGIDSWFKNIPLTDFGEGDHKVYVWSVDRAGNKSDEVSQNFKVDRTNPTFTETTSQISGTGLVHKNTNVSFGGASTDANGIASVVVTYKKDGAETATTLLNQIDGATTWSTSLETDLGDGTYELTFTATDNVGRTESFTRKVMIDTKAPILEITSPSVGEGVDSNSYTIRGTVDDGNGKGVTQLQYSSNSTDGTNGTWIDITKAASWLVSGVNFSGDQGSRTLYVRASDGLNNATVESVTFQYDTENPELDEATIGISGLTTNSGFSFGGTVKDTNSLSSLKLSTTVNGTPKSFDVASITQDNQQQNWSYTFVVGTGNSSVNNYLPDGSYVFTIVAEDIAKRKTQIQRTVIVDTGNPTLTESKISTTGSVVNTGTWYGASSLQISVSASDIFNGIAGNGSGVTKVEYAIISTPSAIETDWNTASWASMTKGSTSTWTSNVQVEHGINYIQMKVTDAASNSTILGANLVANVDLISPVYEGVTVSGLTNNNLLVNKQSAVTAEITASDVGSGVASVKAKIGNQDFSSDAIAATINGSKWNVTIPTTAQKSGTVFVEIADAVGNKTVSNMFTMQVDDTKPEVTFTTASGTVNKVISLAGTASDDQGLSTVVVSYLSAGSYTEEAGSYSFTSEEWITLTSTGTFNWSVSDLNTVNIYDGSTSIAGTQLLLRAVATDKAGNTKTTYLVLTVDQNADRPVIKLSNIKLDGTSWLKNTNTIFGTVSDDDGLVSSVFVSTDGENFSDNVYADGSWEYELPDGDGEYKVYFRVKDSKGTEFTTNASGSLNKPKLQDKNGIVTSTPDFITFRVDNENPAIGAEILSNGQELTTGATFGGGESNTIIISGTATDANGIASVMVQVEGLSPVTAPVSEEDRFTTEAISLADVEDGMKTITITATDNAGLIATATRTIRVDNTPPTVSFQSPLNGATVNGDIEVKGIADDGLGTGISSIKYQVGKNAVIDPSSDQWKNVTDSGVSWLIDFKNLNTINNFAEEMYGTETSTGSGLWDVPLILRVEDNAGNVHVTSKDDYSLRVDPSGDIPKVTLIYPDPTKEKTVLGGIIRIFGSAEDDDAVHSVWMQVGQGSSNNIVTINDTKMGDWTGNGKQVNGTVSWNMSINTEGEFDPAENSTENNTIYFRLKARDINGTESPWTKWYEIEVDKNVPKIGSSEPIQLREELTSTVRPYQQDMWIKDNWILEGSIEDESGIESITISGGITGSLSANPTWFERINDDVEKPNYRMKIPVNTTGAGKLSFTIRVLDKSSPQLENIYSISINYDNVAPTIKAYEGATPIQQSNQTYELKGSVEEGNSGFERLVFWFQRNDGDETRVYNPMETRLGDANRTMLNSLNTTIDGIPRLALTDVIRPTAYSLSHGSISENTNVRVGGLVKIGGLDRRILSVSGNTITWADEVATTITEAYIAYALVVDNMLIETPVWDGDTLKEIKSDDNDGMVETIERSGGSYEWTASINSKNIPDGPIVLRYVVFDKAGNSKAASVETDISNNPPLLAKVTLGTDLNGNGTVDETEKVPAFSALGGDGKEQAEATVASSAFIAKGLVTAEIDVLGGNGALQYTLKEGDGENFLHALQTLRATEGGTINTITLTEANLRNEKADGERSFVFTIWDSTEMTTPGTNSLSAKLTVPMQVDLIDEVSPVVVIDPFYWTSTTENSLYDNSKDNGHIELEADLPSVTFNGTTGIFDTDPKVSGKISVRGSAYDDQRLTAIYMSIDGFAFTGNTGNKTFNSTTYYKVASFDSATGTWTANDQWATNGWVFSVDNEYLDQTGHLVNWQLDWDTSRVDGVAALDQNVRILAEDKRTNPEPNSSSEVANSTGDVKTNNVPYYRMDVVPYVTEVVTSLSDYYRSAPSVFNRTALGHYPVREGESIEIKGFNFNGTDTGVYLNGTLLAAPTVIDGKADSHLGVNIGSVASSGDMILTVAGVDSINNDNNNNVEYNQLPNTVNNNLLRDDVIFDVWEFKDAAVPKNGVIQNPTMKISPTGRIGFSYSNAVVYFSMPGKRYGDNTTVYSQTVFNQSYGWFTNNTFTWDPRGETYGTALCPDTDAVGVTAHYQFFARQAGRPAISMSLNDNYNNTFNAARLDSTAISMHYTTRGNAGGMTDAARATWVTDIDRIKSPAMAASMPNPEAAPNNDTNRVTVHIAYYDKITRQVRYRQGFVGATARDYDGSVRDLLGDNGLPDEGNRNDPNVSASGIYTRGSLAYMQDSSYITGNTIQVVAASGVNVAGVLPQYEATTPYGAGQFVDLGVIQTNAAQPTVVIAWYDTMSRQLMLSYNATPNTYTENYASGKWDNTWVNNTRVIDANGGQNVKMAIDSDGGIHLAYYNTNAGDLKYAYLASVTAAPQTVVVDSFLAVGARCTIDVAKVGTVQVPHISYQMNALSGTPAAAKYAYRVAYTNNNMLPVPAGTDSGDRYTGSWEITSIPTDNTPIDDQINVGVHKVWNGAGRGDQLAIPGGTDVSVAETNAFPVSDSTIIYGNGTMNAVVAYAVEEDGVLEMAQKK